MKQLSKNKNVSYVFELEQSDKSIKAVSVNDLPVVSATGVEISDVAKWLAACDTLKLENLLKLANNHQLFHSASSAHKALARKVAEGSMKREELEAWVYSHDFDSEGKKSVSKAEKIAKLLGITVTAAQAIVDAQSE